MNKFKKNIEKRENEILRVRRIMFILDFISKSNNSITQELEEFELPKSTYYDWKKKFELWVKKGLVKKKPMAKSLPKQLNL